MAKSANKTAVSSRVGRPSRYTKPWAAKICDAVSEGKSLREICSKPPMPSRASVNRWLNENAEFRDQYARAREEQAEFYADQIISIADEVEEESASVAKAKLQIDARKWKAAKLAPKKYGDKVEVDNVSSDGTMTPKGVELEIRNISNDDLERIIAGAKGSD